MNQTFKILLVLHQSKTQATKSQVESRTTSLDTTQSAVKMQLGQIPSTTRCHSQYLHFTAANRSITFCKHESPNNINMHCVESTVKKISHTHTHTPVHKHTHTQTYSSSLPARTDFSSSFSLSESSSITRRRFRRTTPPLAEEAAHNDTTIIFLK